MLFETDTVRSAELDSTQDPQSSESTPNQPEGNGSHSFGELLEEYDYVPPQRGQILDSVVLEASDNAVILDVGLKRDAIVPRRDLEHLDDETRERITRGQELKVWVLRPYSPEGELIVSINKALELEDWERAQQLLESDAVVEARVVDRNKGGLLVQFGRLRGFVPNSHVSRIRRAMPPGERDEVKSSIIGETLRLKVLEVDRWQNRLVLSEREALRDIRQARLRELEPGQILEGTVVHLVDFGAFVDIGGVDGLIHVSRLAHHHVKHPRDELSVGDKVTVRVNSVDVERERISLDRRALLPDPWDEFAERHRVNDLLTGTVANVVDYGIFVNVAEGVQGLVHVSNMSTLGLSNPQESFRQGEEVLVRIIDIDPIRQRIALSIDDVTVEEQEEWLRQRRSAELAAEAEAAQVEVTEEGTGASEVEAGEAVAAEEEAEAGAETVEAEAREAVD